jgi:hypothetical protein
MGQQGPGRAKPVRGRMGAERRVRAEAGSGGQGRPRAAGRAILLPRAVFAHIVLVPEVDERVLGRRRTWGRVRPPGGSSLDRSSEPSRGVGPVGSATAVWRRSRACAVGCSVGRLAAGLLDCATGRPAGGISRSLGSAVGCFPLPRSRHADSRGPIRRPATLAHLDHVVELADPVWVLELGSGAGGLRGRRPPREVDEGLVPHAQVGRQDTHPVGLNVGNAKEGEGGGHRGPGRGAVRSHEGPVP